VLQIAHMFVKELTENMKQKKIELDIDEKVFQKLARDGFNPVYGARPLRREVERQLENPLAMKVINGEFTEGSRVRITVEDNVIAFAIIPN